MQRMTYLFMISFTVFFIFFFNNLYAAKFYRHVPCTLFMHAGDALIIDYAYLTSQGIHCFSRDKVKIMADFSYKGRAKSALLPISFESDHVPAKAREELADPAGQFSLTVLPVKSDDQFHEVICDYAIAR